MAFGIEGFLMTMHKKHLAMDAVTHALLGYTMLAGALGVILELRAPHNFLVSVFRAFAVMLQGVWLMAVRLPSCLACVSIITGNLTVCSSQSSCISSVYAPLWISTPGRTVA